MQSHKHKMLAISAMPEHVHILIGYNVNQLIPDLVEEIKTSNNKWIREKGYSKFIFEWQRGYGAFTHSRSQLDVVVKYILAQEEHHHKETFKKEYLNILEENEIEFRDEYLFEFFDDNNNSI